MFFLGSLKPTIHRRFSGSFLTKYKADNYKLSAAVVWIEFIFENYSDFLPHLKSIAINPSGNSRVKGLRFQRVPQKQQNVVTKQLHED